MGKWKYLRANAHFFSYAVEDDREKMEELYDLDADIGERTNLVGKHPDVLARLRAATDRYIARKPGPPPGIALKVKKLKGRIPLEARSLYTPESSPEVVGKTVNISATIKAANPNGVIVAQGGSLVGYSLYLREGRLILGVRVEKKLVELKSDRVVTGKQVKVAARLDKDGTRSLIIDGEKIKSSGPKLNPQPAMGLSTGQDQGPNVGSYKGENFNGTIKDLILEIR